MYSAHSTVAKRVMDKKTPTPAASKNDTLLKPLKINDEITIIPQPTKSTSSAGTSKESTAVSTGSLKISNGTSISIMSTK